MAPAASAVVRSSCRRKRLEQIQQTRQRLQKILKDPLPGRRQHRLGMKLHAEDRLRFVPNRPSPCRRPAPRPTARTPGGMSIRRNHERVIPADFDRTRSVPRTDACLRAPPATSCRASARRALDAAAERDRERLMAEAHAEHRARARRIAAAPQSDTPARLRPARARAKSRCGPARALRSRPRHRVVADDPHARRPARQADARGSR